jgi:glycosyltransferase involved in cell wall biosynthesis
VTTVHVLLPEGVDDPARPSGGNRFDRRVCDGLVALGWTVRERVVPGRWPRRDPDALAALAAALAAVPAGGLVLLDGLIASAAATVLAPASAAATVLAPASARLRLVALVHMPRPDAVPTAQEEAAALAAMRAVVTTSDWSRRRLIEEGAVPPARVHVALPGVDAAEPTVGSPGGGRLLAVGAVVPHKGQDLLLEALHRVARLDWSCTVAGSLDLAPEFVDSVRAASAGLAARVRLVGPLPDGDLAAAYASADLLVLPSRAESFGLVVLEAIAAGLPVIAFAVGGVPEALDRGPDGLPGLLVPPEDPVALAGALAAWLSEPALRTRLRGAAETARAVLPRWEETVRTVAEALAAVAD